jgi:hypothetical protein
MFICSDICSEHKKLVKDKIKNSVIWQFWCQSKTLKIHTILFQIIDDYGLEASFNITPYTHNFTAQANQIFTVLSSGIWSVAGRPQRAFYA